MNRREKLFRDESSKTRRNPKNEPSFSSILLDEILRSTDTNAEKTGDLKLYTEKPVKRHLTFSARTDQRSCSREHEEVRSCRRAYLVEKWMKDEHNGNILAGKKPPLTPRFENKPFQDKDFLFFSSTSCSSDSSGALSAANPDHFVSTRNPRVPCSVARPPKPVKICANSKQDEGRPYNDQKNKKEAQNPIKSKSRASKIYTKFMNVKQPVSPGGKLTSFINTLFNSSSGKESKCFETNEGFQFQNFGKSFNASYSTRPSAPSSSRSSSLVQNSPKYMEKMRNGIQRKVGHDPVKDLRLSGHKSLDNQNFGRSALVINGAHNDLKGYQNQRKHWEEEDDKYENYDGISESSSDLFELDHLSMYANNRFCDGVRNDLF